MSPWTGMLAVAAGGALGSVCRYLLTTVLPATGQSLPLATLMANVLGCLLLGYLHGRMPQAWVLLLLGVGFCGGLTTFSTLSGELVTLGLRNLLQAGLYLTLSLWLGIGGYWLGLTLGRP